MIHARIYAKIKNKLLYLLKLENKLKHWGDARYLKLMYRIRMGKRLDLAAPKTFSQKIQWLKINDRRPEYTTLVDKYGVKSWVAERIGKSHVVPNLGLWGTFEDIDFEALPEQFVLKCTHDSGGLVICEDRSTLDFHAARIKIERSLSRNYFYYGREWPYLNVKPQILAEVYLPTWKPGDTEANNGSSGALGLDNPSPASPPARNGGLIDYKFYCYHGEPKFLYVSQGLHDHGTAKMEFVTLDWTPAEFGRSDYGRFDEFPAKPENFEAMIAIARELSSGIPFVRVDLFEHLGRILFSEMTFHPVSGLMRFKPTAADLETGQLLDLSIVRIAK